MSTFVVTLVIIGFAALVGFFIVAIKMMDETNQREHANVTVNFKGTSNYTGLIPLKIRRITIISIIAVGSHQNAPIDNPNRDDNEARICVT